MNKATAAAAVLVSLTLAGCAGTDASRANENTLAYTWEAENRIAKVNFHDNHSACARSGTIGAYEDCMATRGYSRVDD